MSLTFIDYNQDPIKNVLKKDKKVLGNIRDYVAPVIGAAMGFGMFAYHQLKENMQPLSPIRL